MKRRKYFVAACPRCGDRRPLIGEPIKAYCGNCLMNDGTIIEMKLTRVQPSKKGCKPSARLRRPPMCEECGKYPADLPGRLCPGCDAYREHQS